MTQEYTPIPTGIIFDPEVSRPVLRTYARLRALAWNHGYTKTDPIKVDEVCRIAGLEERQLYNHIAALRKARWLQVKNTAPKIVEFKFPLTENTRLMDQLDQRLVDPEKLHEVIEKSLRLQQQLMEQGIKPGIARNLAMADEANTIQKYINAFIIERHKRNQNGSGHSITAGWLVRAITDKWEIDEGTPTEPIQRCSECGGWRPRWHANKWCSIRINQDSDEHIHYNN